MALTFDQAVEDEKKKKLQRLNQVGSLMPGAERGQETGRLIGEAYNKGGVASAVGMGLRRAPGDIVTGVGDFLNKGIVQPTNRLLAAPINALADIGRTAITGEVIPATERVPLVPTGPVASTTTQAARPSGSRPSRSFSASEPKADKFYDAPIALRTPTLKELPNAQRDAELGKMNVGIDGNIVTYDIGGNTLSYDASQTDPSKISLRNINKSSSNAPTWDDYHAQQTAKYNAYMNAPRGRYFGPTPLPTESPESSDKSLGGLFLQGLQARKDRTYAQIENDIAGQDINRAEAMTQANRNLLMADSNRISEMDVLGQNKLRDIQGQVAQQPVAEENKPVVLDSYEPNPINPAETLKKQRVVIRDAEGNFIDVTPKPTFTESQEEIAEKLSKMRDSKDPRLAAAEAKYKAAFGNLPY